MTENTGKTKKKRLPQGLRKHVRRLKQEARKEGTVYRSPIIRRTPAKTTKS
jgi:hypothetical protein